MRFTDQSLQPGSYTYMIRAVSLVNHFSGSCYDPSRGIFTQATVTVAPPPGILLRANRVAGGIQSSWKSQAGTADHIEATAVLGRGTCSNVSGTMVANGANTSWTDSTSGSHPRRFYRIASP